MRLRQIFCLQYFVLRYIGNIKMLLSGLDLSLSSFQAVTMQLKPHIALLLILVLILRVSPTYFTEVCHMCCIEVSNRAPRNAGETSRRSNVCINGSCVSNSDSNWQKNTSRRRSSWLLKRLVYLIELPRMSFLESDIFK